MSTTKIDHANALINELLQSNLKIPFAVFYTAQTLSNCLAETSKKGKEDAVLDAKKDGLLVKLCAHVEYVLWDLPPFNMGDEEFLAALSAPL